MKTSPTRQGWLRGQVAAMSSTGVDPATIAEWLGLTEARVDALLDQIEGEQSAVPEPGAVTSRTFAPTPKSRPKPPAPRARAAEKRAAGDGT